MITERAEEGETDEEFFFGCCDVGCFGCVKVVYESENELLNEVGGVSVLLEEGSEVSNFVMEV